MKLKAHRLKREAKVMQAMQAEPNGSLDDWVATPTTMSRPGSGRSPNAP